MTAVIGAFLAWQQCGVDFVGAPGRAPTGSDAAATARAAVGKVVRQKQGRYGGRDVFEARFDNSWMDKNPFWSDYFDYDEKTDILVEKYPGARSFNVLLFCIFGTIFFLAFLFVGYSLYVDRDLSHEWNLPGPLYNLRRPPGASWNPNGFLMSSIGALGTFILLPFQYYCYFKNPGEGGCYFDRRNDTVKRIYDGKVFLDEKISTMREVRVMYDMVDWNGLKEVTLVHKAQTADGEDMHFRFAPANQCQGKMALEEKGKCLADFLGLEFDVDLDGQKI